MSTLRNKRIELLKGMQGKDMSWYEIYEIVFRNALSPFTSHSDCHMTETEINR